LPEKLPHVVIAEQLPQDH